MTVVAARLRLVLGLAAAVAVGLAVAACDGDDGGAGAGVTQEPCPPGVAVNDGHGCVSLGLLTDLTGEHAEAGRRITAAQQAFWRAFNAAGGVAGHDVDAESHVRDTGHDPDAHRRAWQELAPQVLALAQSLGSAPTAAILEDVDDAGVVMVPTSATSGWAFLDSVAASGASWCVQGMHAVDHAAAGTADGDGDGARSVLAVHYRGDYGEDAAAGARAAAAGHDLGFSAVEVAPGEPGQPEAVAAIVDGAIVDGRPDAVVLATGPADAAAIVGHAAARGYQGLFVGVAPTWDPGLRAGPAAAPLRDLYRQVAPWPTFHADTPGHARMRAALGEVGAHDDYTAGWVSQYPLAAAISAAAAAGDLSRDGVLEALGDLDAVDYEGMLPAGAGRFGGEPRQRAVRAAVVHRPDPDAPTGLALAEDFTTGPSAARHRLSRPCYPTDRHARGVG